MKINRSSNNTKSYINFIVFVYLKTIANYQQSHLDFTENDITVVHRVWLQALYQSSSY